MRGEPGIGILRSESSFLVFPVVGLGGLSMLGRVRGGEPCSLMWLSRSEFFLRRLFVVRVTGFLIGSISLAALSISVSI
jgi:hypothetical protein